MESLEIDPLTEFYDSIKNPLTKNKYERRLALFFNFLKIEGSLKEQAKLFASQAKKDNPWATFQINEYMRTQKARAEAGEISESTIPNFYKPIKLFCEENDIILNWKKISRRIPKGRRYANDRAPTREEIRTILGYHDPRIKPIVLTMVSSGIRVGAWDELKVKHLEPIEKDGSIIAGRLKVYADSNEAYTAFVSPEAYRALKAWLDSRIQAGEKVTKESWLMRDLWEEHFSKTYRNLKVLRRGIVSAPRKLSSIGVKRLIERSLITQGLRKNLEPGKRRHEFQVDHGFRKYFNTVCDRHMRTLYVEFLMGHNTGLKESYNRATEEEILQEYLKAVPELTILEDMPSDVSGDLEELKQRNATLEERVAELEEQRRKEEEKRKSDADVLLEVKKLLANPEVARALSKIKLEDGDGR